MTSILSSLIPFYSNGINSASQVSGNQSLLDLLGTPQKPGAPDDIFGDAFTLDISGDSLSNTLNPLTYSNIFSPETALANGGPLPAFIAMVDAQLHLNPEQQQALQHIADENMDATKNQDTIQKIAMELQQAGIGS